MRTKLWKYNNNNRNLPSVSLRGTVKSSSLVICLCRDPKGNVGIVVDEVWVALTDAESDGGRRGLHGECELAEVLEDAANGTPVDGYSSWLNYNKIWE